MVRIISMSIENFKCFRKLDIEFKENDIFIYGDNETGKTSIFDAFCWCMYGTNSIGEKSFLAKTQFVNSLVTTTVSVNLEISDDSRPIKFCRMLKPKLNKHKEFMRYETECQINDLPKGVREFEREVDEIAEYDVFLLLTMPRYFMEQINPYKGLKDWEIRRTMLFKLCDEIDEETISKKQEKFQWIPEYLKRYKDSSEILSMLKIKISELEKNILEITIRIDQQSKNVAYSEFDDSKLRNEILPLQAKLKRLETKIEKEKNESENVINEINKKISELKLIETQEKNNIAKAKLLKKEKTELKIFSELKKLRDEHNKLALDYKNKVLAATMEREDIQSKILLLQQKYESLEDELIRLKLDYKNIKSSNPEICPTCKREFDNAEDIKRKNKAMLFNVKMLGIEKKDEAEELRDNIKKLRQEFNAFEEPEKPERLVQLEAKINELMSMSYDNDLEELSDNLEHYKSELEKCSLEIEQEKNRNFENISNLTYEKMEIENKISNLKAKLNNMELEKQTKKTLDELIEKLKTKQTLKSDFEFKKDSILEFIQYKCNIYEENLNSIFQNIKWKLFSFNKTNEELRECCIPLYNGIEYKNLSESTKTICGIEIIEVFQKSYNIELPIFIDNAEGITNIRSSNYQIIRLLVESEDCPICGGKTGRRKKEIFVCENCNHEFKKSLKFEGAFAIEKQD